MQRFGPQVMLHRQELHQKHKGRINAKHECRALSASAHCVVTVATANVQDPPTGER